MLLNCGAYFSFIPNSSSLSNLYLDIYSEASKAASYGYILSPSSENWSELINAHLLRSLSIFSIFLQTVFMEFQDLKPLYLPHLN